MRSAGLLLACWLGAFATVASGEKVCLSNVDGAIGPATASYISRSVDEAKSQGAQCLIIQLNTPGGLLDSTRVIVQKLLGASIPVVVYVAPTGALQLVPVVLSRWRQILPQWLPQPRLVPPIQWHSVECQGATSQNQTPS